jgi:CubicO group peptidase (beta-lactamase class C family)
MRPRLLPLLSFALAMILVASACSGDDDGETSTDTGATADTKLPEVEDDTIGASFPGETWDLTSPQKVGLDQAGLDELASYLDTTDSNCLVVIKDGQLVEEVYWNGTDADANQEIWSASKSVTSTLVGLAQEQGFLEIEQPASDFITEWQGTPSESVTIENLLSNDSGRYWDFETDYLKMAAGSPDRTAFAIGLDQQHDPGTHWEYNNSAIQTLEAVLERSTGQDVEDFAQENLFEPIGMTSTIGRDQSGTPATFMGVQAGCLDMARFGYLFLQHGNWDGEQVVPAEWTEQATAASQDLNQAYGYLWWRNTDGGWIAPGIAEPRDTVFWEDAPLDAYAALGLGGQIVLVLPNENMVVARAGPNSSGDDPTPQTDVNEVARLAVAAQD